MCRELFCIISEYLTFLRLIDSIMSVEHVKIDKCKLGMSGEKLVSKTKNESDNFVLQEIPHLHLVFRVPFESQRCLLGF